MAPRKKIAPNTIPMTPPSADELQQHLDDLKKKMGKKKAKRSIPSGSPEHYPGGPGSFYGTEDVRII